MMKKTILSALAVSAVSAVSMTAAQAFEDIPHYDNRAYVWDSYGNVVRDRWGNCVRTIHWTEDSLPCGTDPDAVKTEPAPEPSPEPPIVTEPAPKPEPAKAPAELNKPDPFRGFFDTNKATLRPLTKDKLDIYADYMKRESDMKVRVVGHTDSRGTQAYNQDLSQRRAASVKVYLIDEGIDADRIMTDGQGESNPIASNDTADGRQQNRRVELTIVE